MTTQTDAWPKLDYADWKETLATLHLWTQVVGKVRLALAPWWNHSWHVPLYVTARGLTTSAMPYEQDVVDMEFDFLRDVLEIRTSRGESRTVELRPRTVADFYADVMASLKDVGVNVTIDDLPTEIPEPIRFSADDVHKTYDAEAARRFWRVLVQTDRVFKQFQTGFLGKSSPVHFFWGSFDMAVTRFNGDDAPPHPGGIPHLSDEVVREAYSHAVSSAGFWPGGGPHPEPIFYSYAYPGPEGFAKASVQPDAAGWLEPLGEFALSYEAVRTADDPDAALLAFLQSTYEAAADLGGWDRAKLDCEIGQAGVPRAL